ncbi:MAG: mucoidy inhibitor MuiA family protein [Deltaproteobacteria bacterium]|nr:mucoidy inhibitor MuiA family protein [Deltaproteobacteria bacterium]
MTDPTLVETRATRVTFFEDRAEVVRRATVTATAGVGRVSLGGVGVAVDDASLVASVVGDGGRVLAARVLRRLRAVPAASEGERHALEHALREARDTEARALATLERASARARRVEALCATWTEALQRVPRLSEHGGAEAWTNARGRLDGALDGALDAMEAAQEALERAQEAVSLAALRHQQGALLEQRAEAWVELQLEASNSGELTLELVYRTPCALWRPEHLGRLQRDAPGPEGLLELVTWATAWQATGERWEAVTCRFSTARPARAASAPRTRDDVLSVRRKTEAERRATVVEAREQHIAVAGLDRGARAVEEMPGVEDGGEALTFEAPLPATIPSDGQPVRVEVARCALPCAVDCVVYPEKGAVPHLRATATLKGKTPLLAGPVRVVRGTELVGLGQTGFVAPGEPFELGFGVEDGLRVRRQTESRGETEWGNQRQTRTVKVYVSNLGGASRALKVVERVPVSELKDLTVTALELSGGRLDEADGAVRWSLELAPRGTQTLTLVYRLEAPSRVVLPL